MEDWEEQRQQGEGGGEAGGSGGGPGPRLLPAEHSRGDGLQTRDTCTTPAQCEQGRWAGQERNEMISQITCNDVIEIKDNNPFTSRYKSLLFL